MSVYEPYTGGAGGHAGGVKRGRLGGEPASAVGSKQGARPSWTEMFSFSNQGALALEWGGERPLTEKSKTLRPGGTNVREG